jgi:hypothetical protein
MGYKLDSWGSVSSKVKIFLFSIVFRPTLGSTQPPIQWVLGALSLGIKLPEHEGDCSPPSAAEVKNGGAIPSLPDMSSWHSA